MPLIKPKDDKTKKGVNVSYDSILCCMCPPKKFTPQFRYTATGANQFFCKNCGHQLTFKQIQDFHGSPEFEKQKAGLKS